MDNLVQEKLSFAKLAILAMSMVNRPITPPELWDFVLEHKLHYQLACFDVQTQTFSGKTPQMTFCRVIYTDKVNFQEVDNSKPKQYVLKNSVNDTLTNQENNQSTSVNQNNGVVHKRFRFHERDLHPILAYFLKHHAYFKAHAKTIFHEESFKGKKGGDKWLYPDMVAVNFEYANYQENNVLDFIKKFDILPIKIFSFEIKKELNFNNYKESFFQAVSNSSWANEGYLVAYDIEQNSQFIEALQKLSQSFGIGVIELNLADIQKSQILSPARFKEKMDYSVVDELATKNPNFAQFLKTVTDFDLSNPNRFLNEFDKILSNDKLVDYLNSQLKIKQLIKTIRQ